MIPRRPVIVFVLGPSGAGKSTLGRRLEQNTDLLHLEIDQFPEYDGIDVANLRAEWDSFFINGVARPMVDALRARIAAQRRAGITLTFPNLLVLTPEQLNVLAHEGVTSLILYGTASECLDSFVASEAVHRRLSGADPISHWITNNQNSYMIFSRPEYGAFRFPVFNNGRRLADAKLVAEIRRRIDD